MMRNLIILQTLLFICVTYSGEVDAKRSQSQKKSKTYQTYNVYHTIKAGDALATIAKKYKISTKELRRWNGLKSNVIRVGDRLVVGHKRYNAKKASTKQASSGSHNMYYKVRKGDSLSRIAKRYGTSVKQIKQWNRLKNDVLRLGQNLIVGIAKNKGHGRLADGVLLEDGPGYYIKRPSRMWGKPRVVQDIKECIARTVKAFPTTVDVVLGDISREGGGYLSPHRSHRTGEDLDVGYYLKGNISQKGFKNIQAADLDVAKTWYLIQQFLQTGHATMIFIDYRLQKPLYEYAKSQGMDQETLETIFQYPRSRSERSGIIRHIKGHRHHFHVRFGSSLKDLQS